LQDVLNAETTGGVAGTATVALRHTEVQSQLSQGAQQTVQSVLAEPRALRADAPNARIATKAPESSESMARAAALGQGAVAASNSQTATSDATAEQNRQGTADSSVSPDTATTPVASTKTTSAFANALAGNAVAQPDTAQLQNQGAGAPAIVAPPPAPETASHPPAPILPSASAQAQQPPPTVPGAPETTPTRFVNDAQLTTAASQSEMRIAMQTDKLGAIELHARVSGDEVGAAIIVEKRDAHAALAVELPALRQALSDKQLRVDQVELTQGALHSTAGDAGGNTPQGQRGMNQPQRANVGWSNSAGQTPPAAAWFVPETTGIFDTQGRLSVQA